jgi:hypothetical protein
MEKKIVFLATSLMLYSAAMVAQNVNVSGIVYGEDGEPVVGASVKVDGT